MVIPYLTKKEVLIYENNDTASNISAKDDHAQAGSCILPGQHPTGDPAPQFGGTTGVLRKANPRHPWLGIRWDLCR